MSASAPPTPWQELDLPLSSSAGDYLRWTEEQTGKAIRILITNQVGLKGMDASFRVGAPDIEVRITSHLAASPSELEVALCHEATHGLLFHGLGYFEPKLKAALPRESGQMLGLLVNMVDDIVVSKTLSDHGLPFIGADGLREIERDTGPMVAGKRNERDEFWSRPMTAVFLVQRFVVIWGVVRYVKPTRRIGNTMRRFLRAFPECFPLAYSRTNTICRSIKEHNIFTPGGRNSVVVESLGLWGLDDLIELAAPSL